MSCASTIRWRKWKSFEWSINNDTINRSVVQPQPPSSPKGDCGCDVGTGLFVYHLCTYRAVKFLHCGINWKSNKRPLHRSMLATDTCCSSEFNKFFVYSGNNFNSIHLVSLSVRAKAGQPKLYRSAAWR